MLVFLIIILYVIIYVKATKRSPLFAWMVNKHFFYLLSGIGCFEGSELLSGGFEIHLKTLVFRNEVLVLIHRWCAHVSLNIIDGVGGPLWFLVETNEYFSERIDNPTLFEVLAKLFLFISFSL